MLSVTGSKTALSMKDVDQNTGEDLNPVDERVIRVVEDPTDPEGNQPGPSNRKIEGLGRIEDVDQDVDNKRKFNKFVHSISHFIKNPNSEVKSQFRDFNFFHCRFRCSSAA